MMQNETTVEYRGKRYTHRRIWRLWRDLCDAGWNVGMSATHSGVWDDPKSYRNSGEAVAMPWLAFVMQPGSGVWEDGSAAPTPWLALVSAVNEKVIPLEKEGAPDAE